MTFRFPRWLAYSRFAVALAMAFALYAGTKPMLWGWLLFSPLFLYIVYEGARAYSYSITVNDSDIIVSGFNRASYPISKIAEINVWPAKGKQVAVISFSDRRKFSFPSHLLGFEDLVGLLRKRSHLEKPATTS